MVSPKTGMSVGFCERTITMQDAGFEELVRAALAVSGAEMGNIQLVDGGALRLVGSYGFARPFLDFFGCVADQDSACGTALRAGQQVVVADVRTSPIFAGRPSLDAILAAGCLSVVSTPLVARAGRTLGMLSLHRRAPLQPPEDELQRIERLSRRVADCIAGDDVSPSLTLMADSHRLIENSRALRREAAARQPPPTVTPSS